MNTNNLDNATRDYQMDNIRFIMISCVVFGHLLEATSVNTFIINIYRCIYSFHIPVLLFISGFFARFNPGKVLRRILLPYVVFQVIYLAFDYYVLHNSGYLVIQFTLPYWFLWYLLTLFYYSILLPLFHTSDKHTAIMHLIVCVLLALVIGFDKTIGYYMSLSRTVVFLPFFIAGHYCASFSIKNAQIKHKKTILIITCAIIITLEYFLMFIQVPVNVFYGALDYYSLESNGLIRLVFLLCASLWVLLFVLIVPNRKLPIITDIGQRTFPVFILHGFIQRVIQKGEVIQGNAYANLLMVIAITILSVITLSIQPINNLFKKLF